MTSDANVMTKMIVDRTKPVATTGAAVRLAGKSVRRLASSLARAECVVTLTASGADRTGETVAIPPSALRRRVAVRAEMAGSAVRFVPHHAEQTMQGATDLLDVGRPHVVRRLEEGRSPFRRLGEHHWVFLKAEGHGVRRHALDALSKLDQELWLIWAAKPWSCRACSITPWTCLAI